MISLPTKLWPCPKCRRSTFGHFLCADCVERARVHRCAELAELAARGEPQKIGARGLQSPGSQARSVTDLAAETNVAPAAPPVEHSRRRPRRGAGGVSRRHMTYATDGRHVFRLAGEVHACPATAVELAALVLRETGAMDHAPEPVVLIHPAAHDALGLPGFLGDEPPPFFAGATRRGRGTFVVRGDRPAHLVVTLWAGDFADAASLGELLEAAEFFRRAVGLAYVYSGPKAAHLMIRPMPVPPPEPPLEITPWAKTGFTVPAFAWHRPFEPAELAGGGWVRAFDRSAAFLAAWRGLYLSDGQWSPVAAGPIGPGPESGRPPGYWLVGEATRGAVAAAAALRGLPDPLARWAAPDGPVWVTTPLLQLLVDMEPAGGVEIAAGWTSAERGRYLDEPAVRLAAARESLAEGGPSGLLARDVIKDAYSRGTVWFEDGVTPGEPLHRPHWYRTITDRHVANTWRALAKMTPGPFAWSGVDSALFVLPAPDAAPAGIRLGTAPGSWTPKGRALPLAEAAELAGQGGPGALLTRMGE